MCAYENILYFNEDSGDVTFCCDEMGILIVNLNNIYLDNNSVEDDLDSIILVRRLAWNIKFEIAKHLKKNINEKLMPIAWHFCMSEDEKEEIESIFTE